MFGAVNLHMTPSASAGRGNPRTYADIVLFVDDSDYAFYYAILYLYMYKTRQLKKIQEKI